MHNLKIGFGFGSTEFHVLRVKNNCFSKYIYYFTKSHIFRTIGESFMVGAAGQKRISSEFVRDFPLSLPNLKEQKQIANYLDNKIANLNEIKSKIQKQISLLEEYKESLIYHVVTGKIDVRGEI